MEDLEYNQLKATELTLGLPGAGAVDAPKGTKRTISEVDNECQAKAASSEGSVCGGAPVAKAQVVGWPPVRSCRMNSFRARKAEDEDRTRIYVKVSMDGAPYLRKVDLKVHKGYKDLRVALENMFQCFSIGAGEGYDHGSAYAITYEDKDGDWMLVGDVPFEMFVSSCKRMRIMKGSEAKGLSSSPT